LIVENRNVESTLDVEKNQQSHTWLSWRVKIDTGYRRVSRY